MKTMGQAKKLNNKRRFTGGGKRPDNAKIKREEAAERLKYWSGLSPQAQLEALDRRLGKGVGAVRQRVEILSKIAGPKSAQSAPKVEAPVQVVADGEPEKRLRAKERRELSQQKRPSK